MRIRQRASHENLPDWSSLFSQPGCSPHHLLPKHTGLCSDRVAQLVGAVLQSWENKQKRSLQTTRQYFGAVVSPGTSGRSANTRLLLSASVVHKPWALNQPSATTTTKIPSRFICIAKRRAGPGLSPTSVEQVLSVESHFRARLCCGGAALGRIEGYLPTTL